MDENKKIAVFPGSFDPITNGHMDILKRALALFDKVIVAVLNNENKTPQFSAEVRVQMIKESTQGLRVEVESFSGLLTNYVKEKNAVVIRSLRATSDFENEFQMSVMNNHLSPQMETVFLMTRKEYLFLSSSAVKEVAKFGGNVKDMVPEPVLKRLV